MKPEFYIMNDLSDCFDGPFKLEIGDIKNPSIYNLKFPKILTTAFSDNSSEIFCFPTQKETLFIDLDWLNSIKDRSLSFLNIFRFKMIMDTENVAEVRRMIV